MSGGGRKKKERKNCTHLGKSLDSVFSSMNMFVEIQELVAETQVNIPNNNQELYI